MMRLDIVGHFCMFIDYHLNYYFLAFMNMPPCCATATTYHAHATATPVPNALLLPPQNTPSRTAKLEWF
jgi:hypothetical protein